MPGMKNRTHNKKYGIIEICCKKTFACNDHPKMEILWIRLRLGYFISLHGNKKVFILQISYSFCISLNINIYMQGCKFSDFCLISENFTSKYLKMFFEISSL